MPLIASLTRDPGLRAALEPPVRDRFTVAPTPSWSRFLHLVRERPVTCAVIDEGQAFSAGGLAAAVAEVNRRFPSVGIVVVGRPDRDFRSLLEIVHLGIDRLVLHSLDGFGESLKDQCRKALATGVVTTVVEALRPCIPRREALCLETVLDGIHQGWGAEALARTIGLSRPHLSVRLKAAGLPSIGHLSVWGKLLHAGYWLPDPGRSAESVSRQLEYSSGAAFRRVLKNYCGVTPSELIEAGGFPFVMRHFLMSCSIQAPAAADRSVA